MLLDYAKDVEQCFEPRGFDSHSDKSLFSQHSHDNSTAITRQQSEEWFSNYHELFIILLQINPLLSSRALILTQNASIRTTPLKSLQIR